MNRGVEAEKFGRVITAMVTPFKRDEKQSLDTNGVVGLAKHLADTGSSSIVVSGTTGESPTLSSRERVRLLTTVLESVGDRIPVIAGTSTYSTEESIELSKEAQREGAKGLLLVTPYYNKPSQEGLYKHFAKIADAVNIPCVLYNVPSRTNVNLQPQTVYMLTAAHENIVGLKEAIGTSTDANRKQIALLMERKPEGFHIWSGNDQDTLSFLRNGGHGVVSVASHLVGDLIGRMIQHELIGEKEEAEKLNNHLMPLFEALFPPTSPEPSPASIKAMLNLVGVPVGGLRLPMVEVPEDYKQRLQVLIADYQIPTPSTESSR